MSPKTLKALSQSPARKGRRSSSGNGLRPVLPFGLDDGSAVAEDQEEGDEPELGPMPTGLTEPFAADEGGKGVDEVEVCHLVLVAENRWTLTPHVSLVHVRRVVLPGHEDIAYNIFGSTTNFHLIHHDHDFTTLLDPRLTVLRRV